ncbi:MAG: hypothetical protein AAFR71_00455 [Pseudomonadota bacterium]
MILLAAEETIKSENPNLGGNLKLIALIAILGAITFWLAQYVQSQISPSGFTDNDDFVRLVQAKDLLAGQGWYDPVQYRLGLAEGTVMHWSRLIDAPIALALYIGGQEFASIAWPFFLSVLAFAGLFYGAFKFGGRDALFPMMVAGFGALWSVNRFWYASFDHHNVQIVLLIWTVVLIVPKYATPSGMAIAGLLCALMLAIGIETLPHVAIIGIWVFFALIMNAVTRRHAAAFAGGLAVSSVLLVPGLLPLSQWTHGACDSFSIFQVTLALAGGGALFLAAMSSRRPLQLAIMLLGGIVGFLAIYHFFPSCLENPFSKMPPLMREFWLDKVIEVQSIVVMVIVQPATFLAYFAIPAVAINLCIIALRRRYERASASLFLALIFVGLVLSFWQVRAIVFVVILSLIPMAIAVSIARKRTIDTRKLSVALTTMILYIASFAPFWSFPAHAFGPLTNSLVAAAADAAQPGEPEKKSDLCYDETLYSVLASEPTGVVLSSTNVGARILAHTGHRAIAGPYHRNVEGILFQIRTMTGTPEIARSAIASEGVTHIADCVWGPDAYDFIKAEPDGFQAQLIEDHTRFDWLELIPETGDKPLRIFRVVQ